MNRSDQTDAGASQDSERLRDVARRVALPTLAAYVGLVLLSRVPLIDSTRPPFVDLGSDVAQIAYWISQSAATVGASIVSLCALLLLVSRPSIPMRRRAIEAALIVLLIGAGAGGGAAINERGVKEALRVPRPNIAALAGADGSGPLRRTAEQFYALGDKRVRSDSLRIVLLADPAPVNLLPSVLEHWVHETGYSFPSGHSFASMFIAVFFLAAATSLAGPRRARVFHVLLLWALIVGLSRPVLRVHTPMDVAIGGAQGIAIAFLALAVLRLSMDRWAGRVTDLAEAGGISATDV